MVAPEDWEVLSQDYHGRIGEIGMPAKKAFVADGTRFLDESRLLDFDVSPNPTSFGSFTSAGAWWRGDRSYGVKGGTTNWDGQSSSVAPPADGDNLPLSYRHSAPGGVVGGSAQDNPGTINILCFDGHVERRNDKTSRDIQLWYPKGSVVMKPAEGMTKASSGDLVP